MKKIVISEQTTSEELVVALTAAYAEGEALENTVLEVEGDLEEATKTINDLKEKLEAKTKEKSAKTPVVKVNGDNYEVTIPKFNYDGKDYTAEDLKSDSDMCKELVAAGFGGLRLVRDRKKSDK